MKKCVTKTNIYSYNMKIRFLKVKNWLLVTAMGALGLSACHSSKEVAQGGTDESQIDDTKPRNEIALMYGVPTMDYVVKGRVIDAKGNPVQGMQVVLLNSSIDIDPEHMMEDNKNVQSYLNEVADTTNAQGEFRTTVKDVPLDTQRLMVRDVNGEKGGLFESQMIELRFTPEDQVNQREGWYQGSREKDVDITVDEK